jgi:hypothetical protein
VTKVCKKCSQTKDLTNFYPKTRKSQYKESKAGVSHYCRSCDQNRRLTAKYGISIEEYNVIFAAQNGRCYGCERHQSILDKKLSVDHNHTTGKVRGLLCGTCNVALGMLKDDPKILGNLIAYLTNAELAADRSNVIPIGIKKVG